MSAFTAREGNYPLTAGVVPAAQHRHFSQFGRCVMGTVATGASWIAGHADEGHTDTRCQADTG